VPSARYVHPEFGYLCPTPRLRREFRVAIVSIVLVTLIGAGFVTFKAGQERSTDVALTMTHVGTSGAEIASTPSAEATPAETESGAIRTEVLKIDRLRLDVGKIADAAKGEGGRQGGKTDVATVDADKTDGKKTDPQKTDAGKTDAGKIDASKPGASKTVASKTACEDNTWTYIDGSCIPGKPRRVKVRAATDSPAIAAAPIGRSVMPPSAVVAPPAAAPPEATPVAAADAPPAAASNAAPSPPAPSQPAAIAAKKPQKIARSHRRNDAGAEASARDDVRRRGYVVYDYGRGGYGEPARGGPYGWFW
jgi:hypothetical protein